MKTNRPSRMPLPSFADHDEEPTTRLANPLAKWWLEQAAVSADVQVAL